MDKQRLCIEHELTSNSTAIIWDLISTDSGLARWMADSVTQEGEQLTFVWGELWSHHEVRTATIVEKVKNQYIKVTWDDEMDSLHSIWTDNLARLRNTCGI